MPPKKAKKPKDRVQQDDLTSASSPAAAPPPPRRSARFEPAVTPSTASASNHFLSKSNKEPSNLSSIQSLSEYVKGKRERAGKERDSLSTASASASASHDLHEQSDYSTPGTSTGVTPAPAPAVTASSSTKIVKAVARPAALPNRKFSEPSRSRKRRRVIDTDDDDAEEEEQDADEEDESADFRLARKLQAQEYEDADSMAMDLDDEPLASRGRTSRLAARKLRATNTYHPSDSEENEDESELGMSRSPSRLVKRPKILLGSLGSNEVKFASRSSFKGKGKEIVIEDSDEDTAFESSEDDRDVDLDSDSDSDLPLASSRGRKSRIQSSKKSAPKPSAAAENTDTEAADGSDSDGSDDFDGVTSAFAQANWLYGRGLKDRQRLEMHHPELLTMWQDLENLPKIGGDPIEQPQTMCRQLKDFQLSGVSWMMEMEKTKIGGGLLGDEMGMGKTIQAVALIMSDWPAKKPSLILVPPGAMIQWQQEISDYTGGRLNTLIYHGTNRLIRRMSYETLMTYDVILMSYNTLMFMYKRHVGKVQVSKKDGSETFTQRDSVIHRIHFHRAILDEAHLIKSRRTGTARACFALKADHKWCLSGTPLQNRIGEFFSLIRFLQITPFACYMCKQCPCRKLHWGFDDESKCNECTHVSTQHISVFNQELLNPIQIHGNSGPGAEAFRKLGLLTGRFMLRRVKRDHASAMELPAKEVYVDRQFFGEEENDFATSVMSNSARKFETYVAQGVLLNNYANIFGLIMQMRQVADHPDLILKRNAEGGQNILVCCICDETAEDAIRSQCKHDFCRECAQIYLASSDAASCPQCHIALAIDLEQSEMRQDEQAVKKNSIINRIKMENWTSSSKIETLVHDLHELRSRNSSHKSIIFSQFTTMLQLVEWRLRRAGITTVMLDGSMTPEQRQASINHFKSDVNVECFLVSLKAGGVALNLTEASRVFIVDPWWNPAAEWQSADRCHRIGQSRPCHITRLCIEDSVESRMVLLQEKKANMINSTINSDQKAMESLTTADMQFLFRGS